jgi:hypothetical protein
MVRHTGSAMLATLAGCLALLLGLATMLLPLLAPELSRPRDSGWGALVLLLGLVLVTSADRLSGAPMLAVVCGGLLTGRLGQEVALGRWRQLSDEERQRLGSAERWSSSLQQLRASLVRLIAMGASLLGGLQAWLAARRSPARSSGKRWVRPEADVASGAAAAEAVAAIEAVPEIEAVAEVAAENPEPEALESPAEPEDHEPEDAEPEGGKPESGEPEALEPEPFETVEAEAVEPAAADAPAWPALGRRSADLEALAALEEVAVEIDDLPAAQPDANTRQVRDFNEIDALLQAATGPQQTEGASGGTPPAGRAG